MRCEIGLKCKYRSIINLRLGVILQRICDVRKENYLCLSSIVRQCLILFAAYGGKLFLKGKFE